MVHAGRRHRSGRIWRRSASMPHECTPENLVEDDTRPGRVGGDPNQQSGGLPYVSLNLYGGSSVYATPACGTA